MINYLRKTSANENTFPPQSSSVYTEHFIILEQPDPLIRRVQKRLVADFWALKFFDRVQKDRKYLIFILPFL